MTLVRRFTRRWTKQTPGVDQRMGKVLLLIDQSRYRKGVVMLDFLARAASGKQCLEAQNVWQLRNVARRGQMAKI